MTGKTIRIFLLNCFFVTAEVSALVFAADAVMRKKVLPHFVELSHSRPVELVFSLDKGQEKLIGMLEQKRIYYWIDDMKVIHWINESEISGDAVKGRYHAMLPPGTCSFRIDFVYRTRHVPDPCVTAPRLSELTIDGKPVSDDFLSPCRLDAIRSLCWRYLPQPSPNRYLPALVLVGCFVWTVTMVCVAFSLRGR